MDAYLRMLAAVVAGPRSRLLRWVASGRILSAQGGVRHHPQTLMELTRTVAALTLASARSDDDVRDACARLVEALAGWTTPALTMVHRARDLAVDRVGILAASFNPPTRAHLRMAEIAHERHGLGEVLLELSIANVDKDVTDAPLSERLAMMLTLVRDRPWLSIGLGTHARFTDKATAIRPRVSPAGIVFIVGADTLVRVFDAKYYADREAELGELFSACTFLCANREDSGWDEIDELLMQDVNRPFADRVARLELDPYHASISSSSVRASMSAGTLDPRAVPESVESYIRTRGLYRM